MKESIFKDMLLLTKEEWSEKATARGWSQKEIISFLLYHPDVFRTGKYEKTLKKENNA